MEMPIPNFCSWNRHGDSMSRSSEFWIPIEFRIPNFCPWNRHGNSMNRSSEFGIPLPFLTYLPKKVKMGCGIPNSELLLMELPWRFRGQKFGIRNSIGILNSELLLLESPWRFHEQKFGIGISMDRSLGLKCGCLQYHILHKHTDSKWLPNNLIIFLDKFRSCWAILSI